MTETKEHAEMKTRIGSIYQKEGYVVEYEVTLAGKRWDVTAKKDGQTILVECERFAPSHIPDKTVPEGAHAYLFVPEWFGNFEALLIDGKETVTLNPIGSEKQLASKVFASSLQMESLRRQIEDCKTREEADTTSYRIGRVTRRAFKTICSSLGFDQSPVLEWLMHCFVKTFVGQSKLDLFSYDELNAITNITIHQPLLVKIGIFEKAELFLAKEELTKLLENLTRGNPEYRQEMQLELAQALKKIQPVYSKTKDPELLSILMTAEKHMGQGINE